jgi:hypothetical protein
MLLYGSIRGIFLSPAIKINSTSFRYLVSIQRVPDEVLNLQEKIILVLLAADS